jgi:hypothetical protein
MNTRGILIVIASMCATACASTSPLVVAAPTNARVDGVVEAADKSVFARTEADTAKVGADLSEMYNDASDTVSGWWKTSSAAWDKASDQAAHYRMITAEQFAHMSSLAERCYGAARASVPLEQQSFDSLKEIADGCFAKAHNPRQP